MGESKLRTGGNKQRSQEKEISSYTEERIAFVWDNFGPMHADRCDSVAGIFHERAKVFGIELNSKSSDYEWESEARSTFEKITISAYSGKGKPKSFALAFKIIKKCFSKKISHVFFCHYERTEIFLAAVILKVSGFKVYTMNCSKFDDSPRRASREMLKRLWMLPYRGGIASGKRSADYMRFLGIRESNIKTEYNTLSIDRIRNLSASLPAPNGVKFNKRHFTIVARLIPKKNLVMAIEAFARYRDSVAQPRMLHICGSGELEEFLKRRVVDLGLANYVIFHGFVQSDGVARILATTLALILPSVEEQFGNVVIEAQAMGLPVILSDVCGARDHLIRTGVNGFVIEPDNPLGLSFFMTMLSEDEGLWRRMATAAAEGADKGDVRQFSVAVRSLVDAA